MSSSRLFLYLAAGAVLLLAAGGGCIYLALNAYSDLLKQPPESEKPHLYMTPGPLALEACSRPMPTTIPYSGLLVGAPWATTEDLEPDEEGYIFILFDTGQALSLSSMTEAFQPMDDLRKKYPQRQMMERMLGPEALRSNYGVVKAALETTPSDVKLLDFPTRAFGAKILLNLKDSLARDAATGLFAVETNDVRGFQFGDPAKRNGADLLVFDQRDRPLRLWIGSKEDSSVRVTQSEIGCIIQSIRSAEEPRE